MSDFLSSVRATPEVQETTTEIMHHIRIEQVDAMRESVDSHDAALVRATLERAAQVAELDYEDAADFLRQLAEEVGK